MRLFEANKHYSEASPGEVACRERMADLWKKLELIEGAIVSATEAESFARRCADLTRANTYSTPLAALFEQTQRGLSTIRDDLLKDLEKEQESG